MEYEDFMIERYLGEQPPLTEEDVTQISSDPEEQREIMDFWNDARENRLKRCLGILSLL